MLMLLNQYYIVFQYDVTLIDVKWHFLEVNITPCENGFVPFKEVQFFFQIFVCNISLNDHLMVDLFC
jgi:hypothetical protein